MMFNRPCVESGCRRTARLPRIRCVEHEVERDRRVVADGGDPEAVAHAEREEYAEDEVRSALTLFEEEARALLDSRSAANDRDLSALRELAAELSGSEDAIADAVWYQSPWQAVLYALRAGMLEGLSQGLMGEYHVRRRLREMEPFAKTGQKVHNANPRGRPAAVSREQLRSEVQDAVNAGELLKKARRDAAKRHGLSDSYVEKLTAHIRPQVTRDTDIS